MNRSHTRPKKDVCPHRVATLFYNGLLREHARNTPKVHLSGLLYMIGASAACLTLEDLAEDFVHAESQHIVIRHSKTPKVGVLQSIISSGGVDILTNVSTSSQLQRPTCVAIHGHDFTVS